MNERRLPAWVTPGWVLEAFALFNLAFLAIDVWLAHRTNHFAESEEWVPVIFSAFAPALLLPGLVGGRYRRPLGQVIGVAVGAASIVVGITGLILHLRSSFFVRQTLEHLVYSAPFVAPLSYAGVGLLLVLNRLERDDRSPWGLWVVFLALGGFVGNFALSVLDHAQNGFFHASEWIPVVAAAYAVGFLLPIVLGERRRAYFRVCAWVLASQVAVGLAGAVLHGMADLDSPMTTLLDRFVYGAPVFAPLLFADLALLAGIGIWQRRMVS